MTVPAAAPRVLVTDGGTGQGRSALAAVRALAAGGYQPWVTVSGPRSLAASSRWCAGSVEVPAATDPAAYAAAVNAASAAHGVVATIPASDAALLALGAPVDHLVHKDRLAGAARAVGFLVPPATTFDNGALLRDAVQRGDLELPVVAKPVVSTVPARRIDDRDGASSLAEHPGPVLVQPLLAGHLRAVSAVVWGGRAVAAVAQVALRTWPVECGTSSAAVTVAVDEDVASRLAALAGPYEGVIQAQWVGDHLVDVNPRVYGSLPLAVAAGVNLVAIWCDLRRGLEVASARGRPGVRYRWLEGDVRNTVSRLASGKVSVSDALRVLRPRLGTAHSVESWRDLRPLLVRARYAVGR